MTNTTKKYGMRLRGYSPGCQPMNGLIKRHDDETGHYYDILEYDRTLTEAEKESYALDELNDPTEKQKEAHRQIIEKLKQEQKELWEKRRLETIEADLCYYTGKIEAYDRIIDLLEVRWD